MEMGHESPAKMDHESPMKRESRELKDMPIVDIEKGKAKGDMKKGSPAKVAKPDFPDIDGDGNTSESMKQAAKDKKAGGVEMKMDGMSMKYGDGPKMNHGDGPEMAYGKGPKMSALHENHVETGNKPDEEDKKPKQPQRMGRIVKKIKKKPVEES